LLAAELVLGLLFLHEKGIVHHEIKPVNIMISATGHAVIGEFGAARRLPNNNSPVSSLPRSRIPKSKYGPIIRRTTQPPVFTSLYYAPESIEPNKEGLLEYNEAIDFWSLGVLLHEVATGVLPYDIAEGKVGRERETMVGSRSSVMLMGSGRAKGSDIHLEDLVMEVRITSSSMGSLFYFNHFTFSCSSGTLILVYMGSPSRIIYSSNPSREYGMTLRN
jgi:serine/threonine protein kinase